MIIFLLFVIIIQLCAIGFLFERSVYTPYIEKRDFKRLEVLRQDWEKTIEENRKKAEEYNSTIKKKPL